MSKQQEAALALSLDADKSLDLILSENKNGLPMFFEDEESGERFISGKLVGSVYGTMTMMVAMGIPIGVSETARIAYLLAAMESRSRGKRLHEEIVSKIADGTIN